MNDHSLPRLVGLPALLALAVLGALLYGPGALRAELLNFDDPFFFGPDNAAFRVGGLAHVLDPRATIANAYLPVAHASLYFDYLLGGAAHPWLPRLHSLLLHVFAAWVLARLLGRLGITPLAAAAAAAVFLAHPALVESVAWVSGRKDVLSGLFALLCLSSVARTAREPGRGALVRVGVFGLLALYAKATVIVLPLLAPLVVALTPQHRPRAWLAPTLVLALLAAIAGAHHTLLAAAEGTLAGAADAGLAARLAQVPGAYLHYLGTLVWPRGLNVLYPEVLTLAWFRTQLVLGMVVVGGWALASLWLARRPTTRVAGLAAGAVLLALLPFNTALPASAIAAADRYLYLAVPFAALAVVALLGRSLGAPVALAAAVLASALTLARVPAFASSEALWRASLATDPRNAVACINLSLTPAVAADRSEVGRLLAAAAEWARYPQHRLRAESSLADLAYGDGRLEAAVRHAELAVAAAGALPDDPRARAVRIQTSLRGAMLALAAEDLPAATRLAVPALTLAPDHPAVIAYRYSRQLQEAVSADGRLTAAAAGEAAAAIDALAAAAAASPHAFDPEFVRAQWLLASGRNLPALAAFDRAIALDAQRVEGHLGKADLLLGQGLHAGAEAAVRDAVRAGLSDINLYLKLGLALAGQGRLEDAQRYYEGYLQVRPRDAKVRFLLGGVLATLVRRDLHQLTPAQLEPHVERIRDLAPDHPVADLLLAVLRRQQRRHQDALVLLEGVAPRLPDDPDVPRLLAESHRDLGYQLLLQGDARDRAVDHLAVFVRTAPASLSTDAARTLLTEEANRLETAGVEAFQADQLDDAEARFRRCLVLLPERAWARYQLGLTLLQRGVDLEGALAELRAAQVGLAADGHDASLVTYWQIVTLLRLDRKDDAHGLARQFVDEPAHRESIAFARITALLQ